MSFKELQYHKKMFKERKNMIDFFWVEVENRNQLFIIKLIDLGRCMVIVYVYYYRC